MDLFSPLLFLIGLIGIALVFYIFAIINLFGKTGRWIVMGLLIMTVLAIGNRWTTPPDTARPDPWRLIPNPFSLPFLTNRELQLGWQDVPSFVRELLPPELGGSNILPLPLPAPTPTLPPATPLPIPLPSPPATPVPSPVPVPLPTPAPTPVPPASIVPAPAPSPLPAPVPQPVQPLPSPTPVPSPDAAPVPAWW